jgi:hypothetical protein
MAYEMAKNPPQMPYTFPLLLEKEERKVAKAKRKKDSAEAMTKKAKNPSKWGVSPTT